MSLHFSVAWFKSNILKSIIFLSSRFPMDYKYRGIQGNPFWIFAILACLFLSLLHCCEFFKRFEFPITPPSKPRIITERSFTLELSWLGLANSSGPKGKLSELQSESHISMPVAFLRTKIMQNTSSALLFSTRTFQKHDLLKMPVL